VPSNNLSVIGGLIGNALQEEEFIKRVWSIKERVHPLSIRTLIGKSDNVGTEIERTSWRDWTGEAKKEKAWQSSLFS